MYRLFICPNCGADTLKEEHANRCPVHPKKIRKSFEEGRENAPSFVSVTADESHKSVIERR